MAPAQPVSGRQQYETRCSRCHGGDATGGESGPNIITQIDERSIAELAAFLRTGRPSSGMPAFDLPAQEMTALTAYVRSLVPVPSGAPPPEVRKKIQTTDGQTIEGRVLNEGMTDLQMVGADRRIHLLRKSGNDRYRQVTSQTDWPTYHGDPSGNRYTKLSQIDKSNVARLAPKWVFPIPNATQVQNTPIVVGGVMYVSSANEVLRWTPAAAACCGTINARAPRAWWETHPAGSTGAWQSPATACSCCPTTLTCCP